MIRTSFPFSISRVIPYDNNDLYNCLFIYMVYNVYYLKMWTGGLDAKGSNPIC